MSQLLSEYESLKILKQPQAIHEQIYFLEKALLATSDTDQFDLYKLEKDGSSLLVVPQVNDFTGNQEHLFYLKNKQIFQLTDDGIIQQLTFQSGEILKMQAVPRAEAVFYVAKQVQLDPDKQWVSELRSDQVGQVTYQLRCISRTGGDELIQTFSGAIRLLDVLNIEQVLLAQQLPPSELLLGQERLVEIEVKSKLLKIFSNRSILKISSARYSPNGDKIISIATDQSYADGYIPQLFLFDRLIHKNIVQYREEALPWRFDDLQDSMFHQIWWLDNQTYLFVTVFHGHNRLYLADVTGKKELVSDEAQMIKDLTIVNEQVWAVLTKPQRPDYLFNLSTHQTMYDPNLTKQDFKKAQKYVFRNRQGAILDGWFYTNVHGQNGPTVLFLHDQLHGMHGEAFNWQIQALLNQGMNVVTINPTGTSGYGVNHFQNDFLLAPDSVVADLLIGLTVAIQQHPKVSDVKHQLIFGAQAGAAVAHQLLIQSNQFLTAVLTDPITNWAQWAQLEGHAEIGHQNLEKQQQLLANSMIWSQATWTSAVGLLISDAMTTQSQGLHQYLKQYSVNQSPKIQVFTWSKQVGNQGELDQVKMDQTKVMIDWFLRYGKLNILTKRLGKLSL